MTKLKTNSKEKTEKYDLIEEVESLVVVYSIHFLSEQLPEKAVLGN